MSKYYDFLINIISLDTLSSRFSPSDLYALALNQESTVSFTYLNARSLTNKMILQNYAVTNKPGIIAVTELNLSLPMVSIPYQGTSYL